MWESREREREGERERIIITRSILMKKNTMTAGRLKSGVEPNWF